MSFSDAYRGKRVLVTGHTGFKGAWLCEWLLRLGARVHGYALPPPTEPALFNALDLDRRIDHEIGDVRNRSLVEACVKRVAPDVVFHLAAQPLVRVSYARPIETFEVNVLGTANLLEAIRTAKRPCTIVCVTSDKCYLNHESGVSYHEEDPLGGKDPYSASKAAAEIVIASYRSSYFGLGSTVSVSSARAGNVLGGGDWATDRILPDCVRSLRAGLPIRVRNPTARRPWQHVLESASGYLWLGAALASASGERRKVLASGFNFGPEPGSDRTVEELVGETLHHWPGTWDDASDRQAVPEAGVLRLDIAKAARVLGWRPVWPFERSVREAVRWYREFDGGRSAQALMAEQISAYTDDATESNQPWAK